MNAPHLFLGGSCFGEESKGKELGILGKRGKNVSTTTLLRTRFVYVYWPITVTWDSVLSYCCFFLLYLYEQRTSETELDKEPEEHASKHDFQDVAEAPNPCIGSILNLRFTTITVYLLYLSNNKLTGRLIDLHYRTQVLLTSPCKHFSYIKFQQIPV